MQVPDVGNGGNGSTPGWGDGIDGDGLARVRGGVMEPRARGRRSFTYRLATLLGIALVAVFALAACGNGSAPYTTISPRTPEAKDIQFLYKVLFYMALVVFVGVQAAIVYT